MRAPGLTALLALAVAAAGCGGEDGPREKVDSYIAQANAVQEQAAGRLKDADAAYGRFARGELVGEDAVAPLADAERALRATTSDLAELRPPAEARILHRRLLDAYRDNAAMAAESATLARYLPAAADAIRPVDGMNRRLRRRLREARTPTSQAAALERFASGIDGALAAMRAVRPAPVVRATHDGQLRRLREVSRLARELRDAVTARDSVRSARLLRRFRKLDGVGRRESRLGGAAIKAYNERLRDVAQAQAAVQQERARLDRELE